MGKITNLEFFTKNAKDDGLGIITCDTCRAMGNKCDKTDHCPTLSEFANFLNGNTVILTQLEYDVLNCLNINHKLALMEDVPVIRDFISKGHFKYAKGKGLTIQEVIDRAKVVD